MLYFFSDRVEIHTVDDLDRKLLNIVQADFPMDSRPYRTLGMRLGVSEEEIFSRLRTLVESGVVRRIGPVFDSGRLGYKSVLVAAKVPEDQLSEVAAAVSTFPQVTHNYSREHEYNLWFTLVCRGGDEIARVVQKIESEHGLNLRILPAERVFKIRVNFEL